MSKTILVKKSFSSEKGENREFELFQPNSAYRLQLSPHFTIRDATNILDYLKSLGVDTIYTSPYFATPKGSLNPYLTISPTHFDEELGSEEDFNDFFRALEAKGLHHILDLVSNHMGATPENRWFYSVLKEGQTSPYAHYFDILFEPADQELKGKILLPILPKPLTESIEEGYIQLKKNDGGITLQVGDKSLPTSQLKGDESLEEALSKQHYLLAYWKDSYERINYRRFFDIIELIGLNMQHEDVYQAFHQKAFELIDREAVQGLRIDHPDGLYHPRGYFDRILRDYPDLYVIVEKILQKGEPLPSNWDVAGSVGYEYLNALGGLFIQQKNEREMSELYHSFTGDAQPPEEQIYELKKMLLTTYLKGEIANITQLIIHERGSFDEMKRALIEILCHFSVYRTYIEPQGKTTSPLDQKAIEEAFSSLELNGPKIAPSTLANLREVFSLEGNREPLLRIQQLMPCIMAKSIEDTFCYRYHRLISLNEVGGSPIDFGLSACGFHSHNLERLRAHPYGLLATSTHDTKRSEDVRYRISLLSEIPTRFKKLVESWRALNTSLRAKLDKKTEYFIYQTLVGFWPPSSEKASPSHLKRLEQYILKGAREAKEFTNWVDNNAPYEERLIQFLRDILCPEKSPKFYHSLQEFIDELAPYGRRNSLNATALKGLSPGVFDLYQGCELFDDSLVDPDNRRPIDFEKRKALLNQEAIGCEKLHIIHKILQFRQEHADLIFKGSYEPINIEGPLKEHVVGFSRKYEGKIAAVIAFRFPLSMPQELPERLLIPIAMKAPKELFLNRKIESKTIDNKEFIDIDLSDRSFYPYFVV